MTINDDKNAFFRAVSWNINGLRAFCPRQAGARPALDRCKGGARLVLGERGRMESAANLPPSFTKPMSHPITAPMPKPSAKIPAKSAKVPPIRVLLAKVGLDGHDRGVKIVARALRDAGMDVIYTGLHRTPEEVTAAAIQEDVNVLGVSLLSGAHMTIIPRILKLLKAGKAEDIVVLAGGVMSDKDAASLKKMGVGDVLLQDTPPQAIVETVRRLTKRKRS